MSDSQLTRLTGCWLGLSLIATCGATLEMTACSYRWGPPEGLGQRAGLEQMSARPLSFELSHEGSLGLSRAELLATLLSSYRAHGGPAEPLRAARLTLSLSRRPLSPTLSSIRGTLTLSSKAPELESLRVSASLTRADVAPLNGVALQPSGSPELALMEELGARLAAQLLSAHSSSQEPPQ